MVFGLNYCYDLTLLLKLKNEIKQNKKQTKSRDSNAK